MHSQAEPGNDGKRSPVHPGELLREDVLPTLGLSVSEAALTNIKTAMELWMETAKEFNDHIPVPQGRRLAFA